MATKTGQGHQEAITGKIWAGGVRRVIDQLNRRKAVGADNITSEILRQNENWIAPLITYILNAGQYNSEMNDEWLRGMVTFIRKNKDILNLDNYKPIALLNAIYKIWACIFGNRLTPLLNLLTDGAQAA